MYLAQRRSFGILEAITNCSHKRFGSSNCEDFKIVFLGNAVLISNKRSKHSRSMVDLLDEYMPIVKGSDTILKIKLKQTSLDIAFGTP